jgi:hypothetical protein
MVAFLEKFSIDECNLNREFFAIYIGMFILKIFTYKSCKKHKDAGFIKFIIKNKGFQFPDCICDEEPFVRNWALGISFYGYNNYKSVFALSNTLFMIENYNRMLYEREMLLM